MSVAVHFGSFRIYIFAICVFADVVNSDFAFQHGYSIKSKNPNPSPMETMFGLFLFGLSVHNGFEYTHEKQAVTHIFGTQTACFRSFKHKMEEFIMKNEITYTEINGINYPNLILPEQPKVKIGKYGQMRLDFLKKHRRGTYTTLLTEVRLLTHLSAIDQEACAQVEYLTTELAKKRGIDENLKVSNPLLWVQEMNNCKASAEEIVLREVISR